MKKVISATLSFAAIVVTVALLGGCSAGPYMPQQQDGWCAHNREWVKPAKASDGTWRDGYCRYKAR